MNPTRERYSCSINEDGGKAEVMALLDGGVVYDTVESLEKSARTLLEHC